MTEQWKRNCRITIQVNGDQERALDLSEFRIVFQVSQATVEQPKAAEIYIYNLSPTTMNTLAGNSNDTKDTQVILECSYGDEPLMIIFKGRVFQYRRGRDNSTDTWLCILAISADKVYKETLINQCVPAGTSVNDLGQVVIEEHIKQGMQIGEIAQFSDQKYPRGRVLFGPLHGFVQKLAAENNVVFDYSDGALSSYDINKYSVEPMQILTPSTGLVGLPQLTSEGLNAKCLLNPRLKRMGRVQVDMSNLVTQQFEIAYGQQGQDQVFKDPKSVTNTAGIFIIQAIEHNGDTRGDEWYTNLVCTAIGVTVPKSGMITLAVDDDWQLGEDDR